MVHCMSIEMTVNGMTCQGCEDVVETAIKLVDGVEDVEADRYDNVAVVTGRSDVDEDAIAEKVRMAGYEASA